MKKCVYFVHKYFVKERFEMLVHDVLNKEELSVLVINELKELGVKYRKEKKQKQINEKFQKKKIFGVHLHSLELTDVVLENGGIVQIPQIVADACQRILEQVETEGLFRKAGSTLRQKEIRLQLESGLQLGKGHHVIDIANVLKSFFRDLPEPLLANSIQETLLRSLLVRENNIKAILMSCLLLPPLTINTLAFFMQFLRKVSLSAQQNKMSIENLAIILTPGLMPFDDISSLRFKNHVKIIQILIKHSDLIGVLPDNIANKIQPNVMITPLRNTEMNKTGEKKKKKRRSGSLTRVFNGLKKFVGAIGSTESLEEPTEQHLVTTPCMTKSAKKRKLNEPPSAFSAKKKKEILDLLPNEGRKIVETPIKETKKSRLSLGGRRGLRNFPSIPQISSIERRWSIIGGGTRKKNGNIDMSNKDIPHSFSPVISLPCINSLDVPDITNERLIEHKEKDKKSEDEFVRIPKSEYEDIKERVTAIESRISEEFCNVRNSLLQPTTCTLGDNDSSLNGPQRVLDEFEKTIEETENLHSPSTEQLAKRLSRELKIRRSGEQRVIRSPSARKIGTIRRRSKENSYRLSRNKTWHIQGSNMTAVNDSTQSPSTNQYISSIAIYPKVNLKRGRPNTLQSGLPHPFTLHNSTNVGSKWIEENVDSNTSIENWKPGEEFFINNTNENFETDWNEIIKDSTFTVTNEPVTPLKLSVPENSRHITPTAVNNDTVKTPMLPPKTIPMKKTPGGSVSKFSIDKNKINNSRCSTSASKRNKTVGVLDDSQNGRASIVRLRAQNAGMVLAKAKLFDGLGECPETPKNSSKINNKRISHRFINDCNSKVIVDVGKTQNIRIAKSFNNKISNENTTPRRKQTPKSPAHTQSRRQNIQNTRKLKSSSFESKTEKRYTHNNGKGARLCKSPGRNSPRIKRLINGNVRSPRTALKIVSLPSTSSTQHSFNF